MRRHTAPRDVSTGSMEARSENITGARNGAAGGLRERPLSCSVDTNRLMTTTAGASATTAEGSSALTNHQNAQNANKLLWDR